MVTNGAQYEEEYSIQIDAVETALDRSDAAGAEQALTAAREFLQLMELYVICKNHRAELAALRARIRDLRATQSAGASASKREELLSTGARQDDALARDARMQHTTERMDKQTAKVSAILAQTSEIEEHGAATLDELAKQRATLEHANDSLRRVDADLGKSHKVVKEMERRAAPWNLLGL